MYLEGTAGANVLNGGAEDDVIFGLGGNDTLRGAGGYDALLGGDGNDSLSGGALDDFLIGGAGNDTLDGGTGDDWSSYEDVGAAVSVSLNITAAQNTLGGGTDKLAGIENLYGSAFNDTLIGNSAVNYLSGGAGNDSLFGGAGDDHLEGGAGNDFIDGGEGYDVVSYDVAPNGVQVRLNGQESSGDGQDTLRSIEAVYGSKFNDTFTDDYGDNYIYGNDGDDFISAYYGGNDVFEGGSGNDTFTVLDTYAGSRTMIGGDGVDSVDFHMESLIVVDLAYDGVQGTGAYQFVLSSIENVTAGGTFYASDSANIIQGLSTVDKVIYRTLSEIGLGATSDTIKTFSSQNITIDVSRIDADTTHPGDQAFTVIEGRPWESTSFTGHAGEIALKYEFIGLKAWAEFDVDGDKVADAVLTIPYSTTAADFIL